MSKPFANPDLLQDIYNAELALGSLLQPLGVLTRPHNRRYRRFGDLQPTKPLARHNRIRDIHSSRCACQRHLYRHQALGLTERCRRGERDVGQERPSE